jgi:hypothetical protein
MANTGLVMACDSASITSTANTTQFWPIGGSMVANATETNLQAVVRSAGTYHGMNISLTANSVNTNTVFTFRKGAADGNQTVTFATTVIGTSQDTTHTDVVAAADKIDIASVPGTTGTFSINTITSLFDSTTNFSTRQIGAGQLNNAIATARFLKCQGLNASAGSEVGVNNLQQKAGTMTNLQVNVSANAKTSSATYLSRLNTANGGMTITIASGGGGVGISEDTTHTDTIAATDNWCTSIPVGTDTTHTVTIQLTGHDFTTTTGNFFQVGAGADADVAGTASTTRYAPIGGRMSFNATESQTQTTALAAFTWSNLTAHQTVASTNTGTVFFRKNTANGNQTFTFGTGAGNYTDSTHTDVCVLTDLINSSFAFGASTAGSFSSALVWGNFSPSTLFTRTITESLGSVTDAVGIMAIRPIAQSITVTEAVKKKAILKAIAEADGTDTESILKTHRFIRTISDSLGSITDSVKTKSTRAIPTSLSVSETIKKKSIDVINQALGTITEAIKKKSIDSLAQADGSISETVKMKAIRTITTILSVSETVKKKAIFVINQANGGVSELVKKKALFSIAQADGSISESITRSSGLFRTISDTAISVSDAVKKKSIPSISQAVGSVTDAVKKKSIDIVAQANGALSEAVKKKALLAISQSALSVSDTIKKKAILIVAQVSISVSESIAKVFTPFGLKIRNITDNVGSVTEVVSKTHRFVRSINDVMGGIVIITGKVFKRHLGKGGLERES